MEEAEDLSISQGSKDEYASSHESERFGLLRHPH